MELSPLPRALGTGVRILLVFFFLACGGVGSGAPQSASGSAPTPKSQRPSCDRGVGSLLATLRRPLRIDVYITRGLPSLDAYAREISTLLTRYRERSRGKLEFRFVEPKTVAERQAAKDDGLEEAAFGDGREGAAMPVRGYLGMTFRYGAELERIPILDPDSTRGLEFWVTNKIREVRDRADSITHRFGVVADKGEVKLTEPNLIAAQSGKPGPTMQGIMDQALPFYEVDEVHLRDGESEIDGKLVGVILTQPATDYAEAELRRIDDFLMRGDKALVVFAGAVNVAAHDPAMTGRLDTHGLDRLLGKYGIEMKREAVLDWERSIAIPVETKSGQRVWLRAPWIVDAMQEADARGTHLLDETFIPFFRLNQLALPFPSTLVAHPDRQPKATLRVVARTTPRTEGDPSRSIPMALSSDRAPKGPLASRAVAIAVEGDIKSAFGTRHARGRILAISASQFLANPFARAGNPAASNSDRMLPGKQGDEDLQLISQPYAQKYLATTILAFKNTLDWASGNDDLAACAGELASAPR
jgi:hypothetical protein